MAYIYSLISVMVSHGSVVGIATGYELEERGVAIQVLIRSRI
jgi:hypothetical protein